MLESRRCWTLVAAVENRKGVIRSFNFFSFLKPKRKKKTPVGLHQGKPMGSATAPCRRWQVADGRQAASRS